MSVSGDPLRDTAANRTLVISRVFDAPRDRVFRVWTERAHAAHWYRPHGFAAIRIDADLRPGGRWRTCIRRDADGIQVWHGGIYREVMPPERLVYTFAWDQEVGEQRGETLITVAFADYQGKTLLTLRHERFDSVAARDIHNDGWIAVMDRLSAYLATP